MPPIDAAPWRSPIDIHGNMPLSPDAEATPCIWCCSCAADAESSWFAAAARLLALGMRFKNSWNAASESFLCMPPVVAVPPSRQRPPTKSSTENTFAIDPVASFIPATSMLTWNLRGPSPKVWRFMPKYGARPRRLQFVLVFYRYRSIFSRPNMHAPSHYSRMKHRLGGRGGLMAAHARRISSVRRLDVRASALLPKQSPSSPPPSASTDLSVIYTRLLQVNHAC